MFSKYVFRRLGYGLMTLWFVVTATFFMIHLIPGDPILSMADQLPENIRANYYVRYGLDKPLFSQYVLFLSNLVKGDLGESIAYPGRRVSETIFKLSPISGQLGLQAIGFGVFMGLTLGVFAAINRKRWPDYIVMFIAVLGVSVPSFLVAALLQYFFTIHLNLLPTTGWEGFKYTLLPTLALSFISIARYGRYMRASCLDVLGQNYILTAEAKGISPLQVVLRHVFRNAILPVLTLLPPQIAMVFTGSFVIEHIFSIPGMGFYFVSSVGDRDYPMILGQTVFIAFLYIVALFTVDLLYGLVDPRIRISKE